MPASRPPNKRRSIIGERQQAAAWLTYVALATAASPSTAAAHSLNEHLGLSHSSVSETDTLSLWKNLQQPVENESIPGWLTKATMGTIFGLIILNIMMSASDKSAIGFIRRWWRGPHIDQLYLPLQCRTEGSESVQTERLISIDLRHAQLLTHAAMASGTHLRMSLERSVIEPHPLPESLGGRRVRHNDAAEFSGVVTKSKPLPNEESFIISVRLDHPPMDEDEQSQLGKLLLATSASMQTSNAI